MIFIIIGIIGLLYTYLSIQDFTDLKSKLKYCSNILALLSYNVDNECISSPNKKTDQKEMISMRCPNNSGTISPK